MTLLAGARPVLGGELSPPDPRLLTRDGINTVVGQPLDELDPVTLAIYHSWRIAVVRHNQQYGIYAAFPKERRDADAAGVIAGLAYMREHRDEAVWGLLYLVDAGPTDAFGGMRDDVLSIAGMLICTNDGFAGGDGLELPRRGSVTYYLGAYDAGSEYNTEQSEDIVDACSLLGPVVLDGDDNGNNNDDINTSDAITPHAGIAGHADLLPAHNWDGPVLMVTITRG